LIKNLHELEAAGENRESIIQNYLFITAGSCGPCRFGTYVTEYRKALRDAGFEGFRVLLFQQSNGLKQATGEGQGLNITPKFVWKFCQALLIGDILNAIAYRIRPYEEEEGITNQVLENSKQLVCQAFEKKTSMGKALRQIKADFAKISVDRTRVKPKVSIIGEFWAMTTEGDGNYKLQQFLEQEGAEVEVQPVAAWVLYLVWSAQYDLNQRLDLGGIDEKDGAGSKFALEGVNTRKSFIKLKVADLVLRKLFHHYSKKIGLFNYHLPNLDEISNLSKKYYDNNLRGGEGHMEVGKLVANVIHNKVNMTLSVKPFGCMPSSGVSDGVQSKMVEKFPEAIFLPIETSGDGAVNVYSRIQMQLFKAKQKAQSEFEQALEKTPDIATHLENKMKDHTSLDYKHKGYGCTAANAVA
jgi:predicted nucleotide-binding protein (sugar kinase/HSP70/actin superfamily)